MPLPLFVTDVSEANSTVTNVASTYHLHMNRVTFFTLNDMLKCDPIDTEHFGLYMELVM